MEEVALFSFLVREKPESASIFLLVNANFNKGFW